MGGKESEARIEANARRIRERAFMARATEDVRQTKAAVDDFVRSAERGFLRSQEPTPASVGFAALDADLTRARTAFEKAVTAMRSAIAEAEVAVSSHGKKLGSAHQDAQAAYDTWARDQKELGEKLAKRDGLLKRQAELVSVERKVRDLHARVAALKGTRRGLREELHARRQDRYEIRAAIADSITSRLDGKLRVTILSGANTKRYAALLANVLKGLMVREKVIQRIAASLPPDSLVHAVETRSASELMEVTGTKTERYERAMKMIDALELSGRLYELDTVDVDDEPLIELKVGSGFKPASRVSTGERGVCILSIALVGSTAPLIIDEPEDGLDSRYVINVLLRALEVARTQRQIIFNTHSPLIAINGHSSRLNLLIFEDDIGKVAASGTIEEVLGPTEEILEGGHAALMERVEQYMKRPHGHEAS